MTDSSAFAKLREVVNKIRTSGPSYPLMTNEQLRYHLNTAKSYLKKNPENKEALDRYNRAHQEIEHRKSIGIHI